MSVKTFLADQLAKITKAAGITNQFWEVKNRLHQLEKKVGDRIDNLELLNTQRGQFSQGGQLMLAQSYRDLAARGERLKFSDVEFINYSQNGEDGILLYIFSLIGCTNKYSVEFCAGDGIQCNSANLIINHGWHGLLCDGDAEKVARGIQFYKDHPNTYLIPPRFTHTWLTAENVNEVLSSNGFTGEIDLLSIDVDGIDYWLWNAITEVSPRVVVVEVNTLLGVEEALTVKYAPNFVAKYVSVEHALLAYCGASIAAFVELGRKKGYRLVGCNRYGFNAFFIRNDVGEELLPEVDAACCMEHPVVKWTSETAHHAVHDFDWHEVK